jgi:hypothetical protein
MTQYKIYAGLAGGFGGANYMETEYFDTKDQAVEYAYDLAVEEYNSYAGLYGLLSWTDCYKRAVEDGLEGEEADEYATEFYEEEMSTWLDYYVEEVI